MLGLPRNKLHGVVQLLFWNKCGSFLLRKWLALRRRVDYVALNYSLNTETNGELWLIDQIPEKPVVFDVGYNAGDYTQAILRCRPGARVVAFDPSRYALCCFRQKHEANAKVEFHNIALSSGDGEAEFHDYGNMNSSLAARPEGAGEEEVSYRVPVMRLDTFAQSKKIPKIHLLKIDAEGYDLHVLEGAGELLSCQAIDVFMFEYADGWINSRRFLRDAVRYLAEKPYVLFRLFNGFLQPFFYSNQDERFDLGCMFVGVSKEKLGKSGIRTKSLFDL